MFELEMKRTILLWQLAGLCNSVSKIERGVSRDQNWVCLPWHPVPPLFSWVKKKIKMKKTPLIIQVWYLLAIITLRSSFKAKTDFSDLSVDTKMIVWSHPATCKISSVDLFHHSMLPHNKLAPSNFSTSFLILLLQRFPQSLFSEFSKLISCFLTDEYDMWW